MTSLEHMSYLVDHDICCNSSVPPASMDKFCNDFMAGKQLVASCLHYVNSRLNPNSNPEPPNLKFYAKP